MASTVQTDSDGYGGGRATTAPSAGAAALPPPRLSIITFNMLCPAYKRCHTSIPTSVGPSPITPEAVTVGAGAGAVATSEEVGIISISDADGGGDGDGDPGDGCTALHLPPALAKTGADQSTAQCHHASSPTPALPGTAAPSTGMLPFGTYPASPINSNRYRESSVASEWRGRMSRILRALGEARADLVCLQEWWGVDQSFREMFLAAPEVREYRLVEKMRTGGKDDGIAVLLRRRWIQSGTGAGAQCGHSYVMEQHVLSRHDIALSGFGNRIGLALQVMVQATPVPREDAAALVAEMTASAAAGDAAPAAAAPAPAGPSSSSPPLDEPHHSWAWQHDMHHRLSSSPATPSPVPAAAAAAAPVLGVATYHEFLLLVTHLTFPHSSFDLAQRQMEVCHLLAALDDVRHKALPGAQPPLSALPVVLLGDFNTAADYPRDFVYSEITHSSPVRGGFASTFRRVHQREPGVTHRNHRGESVPVDFIFLKPGNAAAAAATAPAPAPATGATAAPATAPALDFGAGAGAGADALPSLHPIYSTLLPVTLPDTTWPSPGDFALSDHRPLLTVFELGGLSTRRPTTGLPQDKAARSVSTASSSLGVPDGKQQGGSTSQPSASSGAAAAASASPSPSPNPVAGPGRTRVLLAVLSSSARHLCDAASRTCHRLFGWSTHEQHKRDPSKCEQQRSSFGPAAALPSRL